MKTFYFSKEIDLNLNFDKNLSTALSAVLFCDV